MKTVTGFMPGKTLPVGPGAAMKRIESRGVTCPEGYPRTLVEMYTGNEFVIPQFS